MFYIDDKYSLIENFKVFIFEGIFFKKRFKTFGITKDFNNLNTFYPKQSCTTISNHNNFFLFIIKKGTEY